MRPRLLKLWPQKQHSTQGGGQHSEEGERGAVWTEAPEREDREKRPAYAAQERATLYYSAPSPSQRFVCFSMGSFCLESKGREG